MSAQLAPEPVHPTYGTLDQFLAELKREILAGNGLRIGHHGAICWYTIRAVTVPEETT